MSRTVKANRRAYPRPLNRLLHPKRLIVPLPLAAEHQFCCGSAYREAVKECATIVSQNHMPLSAGLALADMQGSTIRIVVADGEPDKLAVSRAGFQPRSNQWPKFRITGIEQALAFSNREIAIAGTFDILEWLDSTPSCVRSHLAAHECMIECGLEICQHPISSRLGLAHRLGIVALANKTTVQVPNSLRRQGFHKAIA